MTDRQRLAQLRAATASSLAQDGGRILAGGQRLHEGDLAHGYFVAPTLAEAPADASACSARRCSCRSSMLCRVADRDEAMRLANDSPLGLTAGFYGNDDDAAYFFDNIEAGVTYANRPQGATTGAWPGYQPFGGWKGSGSTGKAIASFYYLAHVPARTVANGGRIEPRQHRSRWPKRSTLHVADGASVALEGFTHLIPFAAGHEIIRQKRRDLHLIRMTPDLIYDQMIGMGCAAQADFLLGWKSGRGFAASAARRGRECVAAAARTRRAQPRGHGGGLLRRRGAAAVRRAARLHRNRSADAQSGDPQRRPALTRASVSRPCRRSTPTSPSCMRNAPIAAAMSRMRGIVGAQREAALAATTLLVTVEEIVEQLPPAMNAIVLAALGRQRGRALPRRRLSLLCAWLLCA